MAGSARGHITPACREPYYLGIHLYMHSVDDIMAMAGYKRESYTPECRILYWVGV